MEIGQYLRCGLLISASRLTRLEFGPRKFSGVFRIAAVTGETDD